MTAAAAVRAAVRIADEVVYGYGVAGAQLRGADRGYARRRLDAHLHWRDALRSLGVPTPAPSAAYSLPFPVRDAAAALRLAVRLEDGAATATYALVAATQADVRARRLAVPMLADVATAASHWRARSGAGGDPAFPGQPTEAGDIQPSMTPTISPSSSTAASGSTS